MANKLRWLQIRRRTDAGKTRDKVAHPDPAVAPLGTDEEAGGATTPREEIAASVDKCQRQSRRKRRTYGRRRGDR